MYNKIIESIETNLDSLYNLTEAIETPKKSLFGLSFEDYDIWLEMDKQRTYGSSEGLDFKWMKNIEDNVNKLQTNKKEWKKFQDAYRRGGWQDYIYDIIGDGKGNWTSQRRKLVGAELEKRKTRNKKTAKFMAKKEKEGKLLMKKAFDK